MIRNRFRAALKKKKPALGVWSHMASPMVTELLSNSSFDWMTIDMEHGPNPLEKVVTQLQILKSGSVAPVVRPPWNDFVIIKQLLDAGANTLVIPFVQNAEEARQAVAATRYPPDGIRGVAGGTRASEFGRITDYLKQAHKELYLILQIETADAVGRIEEIGKVKGVDALFIGPADLSASMGHLGNTTHPEVMTKIEEALAAMRRAKVDAGILSFNPEQAARFIEMGFDFVCIASDTSLLVQGAERTCGQFDKSKKK